jgi:hypothetical protein
MVGRSRVRFLMGSLGLFIDNPSGRTTAQRPTHPGNRNEYQEYQLGVGWGVLTTDTTTTTTTTFGLWSSRDARGLNFLQPLAPVQACNGIAYQSHGYAKVYSEVHAGSLTTRKATSANLFSSTDETSLVSVKDYS